MSDSGAVQVEEAPSRGRIGQPDRAMDRCYDLGQLSLKCQTKYMIEWNHRQAGSAIQHACRREIEEYKQCFSRQTDKRQMQ